MKTGKKLINVWIIIASSKTPIKDYTVIDNLKNKEEIQIIK